MGLLFDAVSWKKAEGMGGAKPRGAAKAFNAGTPNFFHCEALPARCQEVLG